MIGLLLGFLAGGCLRKSAATIDICSDRHGAHVPTKLAALAVAVRITILHGHRMTRK
jgi:hypothetical protein